MADKTIDSRLRFTEGHTTPRNEKLLRKLARAIESRPTILTDKIY